MSNVYYAKFNINSNLKEIKEELKLEPILSDFAYKIETKWQDYKYIHKVEYYVESDVIDGKESQRKITQNEIYRFVNTKRLKNGDRYILVGELIREKPDSIKVYNEDTHKLESAGIKERAYGTVFVFDITSETIAFTERDGLGRNQFTNAFKELSEEILKDHSVEIYLKQDPREFIEKVKELSRVDEINVEIISPNFVDKELDDIKREAKKIGQKMDKENITKLQYHFETSSANDEGIDLEGEFAKDALSKFSIMSYLGYAKASISGKIGKSIKKIKSEKNSPLITTITHSERENESHFVEHVMNTIKREATRGTLKHNEEGDKEDSNERTEY